MTIYLDNATTTYPKPDCVYQAVQDALVNIGANPSRGAYRQACAAFVLTAKARASAARLFGITDPEQIIFTANATTSINLVLKGWLRSGDRVLISAMEHNAVVRPLHSLTKIGVQVEIVRCDPFGQLDLDDLTKRLNPPPRLVALLHASNVNGGLQPVEEVAKLCAAIDVPLFLDAAQSAGVQPIHAERWRLGMLACSGHKGLFGPMGLGLLYVRPDLDVLPLIEGGTGSRSEIADQPTYRPDRYESGTPNLSGIAGLGAGIEFILQEGIDAIRAQELLLADRLEQGLAEMPKVELYRPKMRGTGTVAFNICDMHPGDVAQLLDIGFDIAVRSGLHCAPLAHKTLGTFPEGSVRVSPGYLSAPEQIELFWGAVQTIAGRR